MASNSMHNLITLIKRLEAATSRLEDIAQSSFEAPQDAPTVQQQGAAPKLSAPPLPGSPQTAIGPSPPAPAPEPVPEVIEKFDDLINQPLASWAKLSNDIGGLVAKQAAKVVEAFKEQRKFLLITTKAKKPDLSGSIFQDLVKPIGDLMSTIIQIKDDNRADKSYNNLSTVSDSIMVLAWVTIDTKPFKHVEGSLGSAEFWGNKILTANKNKDEQQVEWVKAYYQVIRDLAEYVKTYCHDGLPWNPKGVPAVEAAKSVNAASAPAARAPPAPLAAPAAGGAPPPPPPPPGPPPVLNIDEKKAEPAAAGGLGAVFSELNKGEAVTKGLRKVDKSQMTHKNPSLRAGSTVPEQNGSARGKSPAPPGTKPKPESMRVKKPPKKELEGNKWTIENFEKWPSPIEIEVSLSHSVLISKCNEATIILKGKANAVTVENTNRVSLVVESLVSSVDVVKSNNFALQVMGVIPTVLMDQVDGAQVYLSKESSATRLYSSKSASINLNVLAGSGEDEDYKELPLPSQICSWWDPEKGEAVNEIVSHGA
ncbi:adenylate cyclase associated N terminal-domain-containing protein [Chaetomium tenue]|uniref:Adenylate cyclase associated N terminal-domain-containing protein n=1 Tax=Chaetomium tenue TaxID=1854479 RepID=A0ACB7PBN2_9PEZI|nr:adenylate cyclase associated N terminal-domain-containing protein [Chaetomium globosum]